MDWGQVGIILFRKRGDAIRCIEAFYDRGMYTAPFFLPSKAIFILKDGASQLRNLPSCIYFLLCIFLFTDRGHDFDCSSGLSVYFFFKASFWLTFT